MVTMPATISVGENPSLSPANSCRENKMETTKRRRRYDCSLPTFSWGAQRIIPCVKDPSISSKATLPPLPPPKRSPDKEEKEKSPVAEMPWNLRRRRADASSPVGNGSAVVSVASVVVGKEKETRKTKLSVSLTSMEIRDDFLLMKGKKPASRPKKRPKHVQKQIDEVFPGLWLSEITPELYKVDEEG
ncbi:uncharacterized protein LOC144552009 [Carex rostrata]